MGNSVASPSGKCLPKPKDAKFLQELIDKGVYYLSEKEDGYMWNVNLPKGWGYLHDKTETTYWGGSDETGFLIDSHGKYVGKIVASSSGRDDKESACAHISPTSGKITVKWTVSENGHITLDHNDLLKQQQELQQKQLDDQKRMFEGAERRKYQKKVVDHYQHVDNYRNTAKHYQEILSTIDPNNDTEYQNLKQTYCANLDYAHAELTRAAKHLEIQIPDKILL